jgi:hypothetical protein
MAMITAGWICLAGAAVFVFTGLVCLLPDQLRSAIDRLPGARSRRPKGERLAAQWQRCALRRKLLFSRSILTQEGEIISTLPRDRLTLALIEVVSSQSQLQWAVSGALAGYCLVSAFTVGTFFLGYTVTYPPFIMNDLQTYGLIYAMHVCAIAGCIGTALMFGINIRLTLLRGLLNAVKKKLITALAARS